MVLDIDYFRESPDPDAIGPEQLREAQKKRFKDPGIIDKVVEADAKWRQYQFKDDAFNQLINTSSKLIGEKIKAKDKGSDDATVPEGAAEELLQHALNKLSGAELKEKIKVFSVAQIKALVLQLKKLSVQNETDKATALDARDSLRRQVGNLLHESVPVFEDEKHNIIERTIGPVGDDNRKKYSHVDLVYMIDGVDYTRGVSVSGGRGYFFKGPGVALEQALVQYALEFLGERGSTLLSPPVFMKREVMSEVAQLSQFSEELYKVVGKRSEVETDDAVEEKFLIATAEQPIAAFHRKERLHADQLPIKYAGISECFRQEVGSSGRDTRGIFRVHQFKKIEQFAITDPSKSWDMFYEMFANSEEFCKSIGLSYQVVNIVSGDLNLAAAKKFDLEAWFPGQGEFRELVSCSNCTDYQSRRLEIKVGTKKLLDKKNEFVHMLNSTLCATTRTVCCILESFQVGDFESGGGVVVPEVLRKYMPPRYKTFLPFVQAAPVDEEEANKGKKGKKTKK
eukprot:m.166232 g.166232  ORF g.166232 m.166232 type:complete len:510 (-) comp15274_c0_seq1:4328-5857(-)